MTIEQTISDLGTAFESFKARYEGRLDEQQKEIEDAHTKIAAKEMQGGELAKDEPGVIQSFKALRSSGDFKAHYTKQASGNEKVGLSDFVRAVAGMKTSEAAVQALGRGQDTAGGYAVPHTVMPEILSAMTPASSLMQAGAGVVPLEQGVKSVTSAVVNAIPQAAWRVESGALAQSEPTFRGVTAVPQSLAFMFKVSRELLADAPNMEAALRIAIGQAFAKELDRVGLRGSGTAPEPRGLLNTAGVQVVDFGGANGASLASYAPILQGMGAVMNADGPMPNAVIGAPRSVISLAGLVDTTGQPIRKPELLQSLPILHTSQVPVDLTVGTGKDCSELYVGDFRGMYFLMRENVSIQLLREAFASTGEIGFACHVRADVVIPYPQTFAVVKGVRA
ncbi:MAG: phage major capsid protein [Comamonas sp.]